MAFSDAYELRHLQSVLGQDCLNIWHAEKLEASFTAADIAVAYRDTLLAPMRSVQADGLTHIDLQVKSLSDPNDFGGLSLASVAGNIVGEEMPAFTAWAIRLIRSSRVTRHGQKRLAGVSEASVSNGIAVASIITSMNSTVLPAMFADWVKQDMTALPKPMLIKRIKYTTPSGSTAYRLPINAGEYQAFRPAAAAFQGVTSQVSRKVTGA